MEQKFLFVDKKSNTYIHAKCERVRDARRAYIEKVFFCSILFHKSRIVATNKGFQEWNKIWNEKN